MDSNSEYYFITNYNMELIFDEIFEKLKDENDDFISSNKIEELFLKKKKENKNNNLNNPNEISKNYKINILQNNGLKLYINYEQAYLKDDKNTLIIYFLIKANSLDPIKNEKFEFWVCSYDFLIEKIKILGYKNAKMNKQILISDKEKDFIDSSSPSSESLNENQIINNIIIIKNESFNVENIFKKSLNYLNLADNLDYIEDYRQDLHINRNINKKNYIFNYDFLFDLNKIFRQKLEDIDYYFYNSKSGISFSILQFFEDKRKMLNKKYFYFNTECLLSKFKQKRKYFLFQIAKLYDEKQKEDFQKFYQQIKNDLKNYKFGNIIKIISNNFKGIFIIFDNIKSILLYDKIYKLTSGLNILDNKILVFIQISEFFKQLNLINDYDYKSLKVKKKEYFMQNFTPTEFFYSNVSKENIQYNEVIEKEINNIFDKNKNDLNFLIFLIQLINSCIFSKSSLNLSYNELYYLEKFLPFIFLDDFEKIQQYSFGSVKFRTILFKEIIMNYFYSILCNHLNTNDFFNIIKTNSSKGIFIEKQIIFFLISKYLNFDKINIDKIYCFDSEININENQKEIFFFQNFENAPLYDFAILKIFNNILVLKVYQIGINKSYNALKNLNKEKINIDLRFFIQKINKKFNKKIQKFSFGIITSKEAYDTNYKNKNKLNNNENFDFDFNNNDNYIDDNLGKEEENDYNYKNYNIMKNFCKKNNFEFFIFDPKSYDFYIDKDTNLQNINFNIYIDDIFCNEINKNFLFTNDDSLNIIKLLHFPGDKIQEDRKIIISELKNKNINVKKCDLIAKFFFNGNSNDINFNNLINRNYLLFQKSGENNKITIYYRNINFNNISNLYQTGKKIFVYYIILSNEIQIDSNNLNLVNQPSNFNKEEIEKNNFLSKKKFKLEK